ncbi:Cilia- and flagella-associated protein 47 [Phlyctochytrium planicorne]|nr:Cilia- and flagella-associated protein 47 [Phlyctochytrium planicorne]
MHINFQNGHYSISGPAEIMIRPLSEANKEKKTLFELDQNYTELPVIFKPKLPGKYSGKIILIGQDVSDIRVFSIHGVAISEGSKAEIDFLTPVRQSLTQDIPIVNKTDDDWTIKASLQGQYFTGPHALVAPAHSISNYSVTFKPTRAIEVEGMLTISNLHTAQKHVYHLKGAGQEPLPEEHREIKCSVRDKIKEVFTITNYSDVDSDYDVITDIPNSSFSRKVHISARSSTTHVVEIHPKRSGQFTYLLTYVNRIDQSYVWYTVRLTVLPPKAEDNIKLSTVVRRGIVVEIPIANPLERPVDFEVKLEGRGLTGEGKISVLGKAEATYFLTYTPVNPCLDSGRLTFQSDLIGEFWYDLQLEATEAAEVILPEMVASLGKCAGIGTLPEQMEETIVRAQLHESVSSILTFTNPLLDPIPVTISIKDDDANSSDHPAISSSGEISLMLHRKPRYNIGGLERLDIPFVYTPKKMDRSIVSVIVEMDRLKWGMPDAPTPTSHQVLESRSREILRTDIQVMLKGFLIDPEGGIFASALSSLGTIPVSDLETRLSQTFFVGTTERNELKRILTMALKDSKYVAGVGLALLYEAIFVPTRQGDHLIQFSITQVSTGARWKFPLRLLSHPPLIDDTIHIEGQINKVMGVSFVLRNTSTTRKSFRAYFTRESSGELNVSPQQGWLIPDEERDENDNTFEVTYRATSYGKTVNGTLIIEADDVSWSYEVRGVTPKTSQTEFGARFSLKAPPNSFAVKRSSLTSHESSSPRLFKLPTLKPKNQQNKSKKVVHVG